MSISPKLLANLYVKALTYKVNKIIRNIRLNPVFFPVGHVGRTKRGIINNIVYYLTFCNIPRRIFHRLVAVSVVGTVIELDFNAKTQIYYPLRF